MVRNITSQDKDDFISMACDFYTSSAVNHSIPKENHAQTFDEAMADSPYIAIYIAERDGKCAGYALLAITYSNEAGGIVVWVDELYIKDEFRGKGIGSEMFDYIEKQWSTKAKRFRLELTDTNTGAHRLYERIGYKDFQYLQMIRE